MPSGDRHDATAAPPTPARASTALASVPAQLREIADVAGVEVVEQLVQRYGGSEIWIPRRAGSGHWLTQAVGAEAAEKICAHYRVIDADGHEVGSVRLYVPQAGTGLIARAKQQLAHDLAEGQVSVREAARRAGLSERAAHRLRAKIRDTRQGELF